MDVVGYLKSRSRAYEALAFKLAVRLQHRVRVIASLATTC
jgi:hypothetical protein